MPPAAILKEEGTAPPLPPAPGTHLMEEGAPCGPGAVPLMPPDGAMQSSSCRDVKVEVVVKSGGEEGGSDT